MSWRSGEKPAGTVKRELLRASFMVRIKRGVRPYGGRKMVLVRFDEDTDTVTVQIDTKAGNSMIGADHRTYRFDEVEPATETLAEAMRATSVASAP